MSKLQTLPTLKENQLPKGVQTQTLDHTLNMDEIVGQRISLQTLQPSAKTKGLVGSHGQILHPGKDQKSKPKSQSMPGKIQVFEDRSSNLSIKKVKLEDRGVQTDPVAFQESTTTTSDAIDVEYYSTMAERRRVALAEALEENEQLHLQVETLKNEVDGLKGENSLLKPMAEEAEYLAGVLKDLLGNSESDSKPDQPESENTSDS